MVSAGQTLLVIEAMKVMNQIHAPKAGRVARILVSDASPVEFGQAILLLE
jgi:acetyl-CoA carboxylase biotin carboxyl carrier protein